LSGRGNLYNPGLLLVLGIRGKMLKIPRAVCNTIWNQIRWPC